jgi:hypothetical protein
VWGSDLWIVGFYITTIKHTALPATLQVMLMAEVTAANSTHKAYTVIA